MKKGKMYFNIGITVLCTNGIPCDTDCFCGVIIKTKFTESLLFDIGNYMCCFKKSEFKEVIGQVDLNNVFIK
jgi:hypothetical protein